MYCTFKTAFGEFAIETEEGKLRRVWLPSELPEGREAQQPEPGSVEESIINQLSWHLDYTNKQRYFNFPIEEPGGTPLQKHIYHAMADVPYGGTATYSSLGPARVVGHVCATNPLPIVYPCHRIVPAQGGPGQYRGGAEMKRLLLEHERQSIPSSPYPPTLRQELRALADPRYRDFAASLIPGVDKDRMIGVRLPQLRNIARRLARQGVLTFQARLDECFEETMIRGMLPGYANWADFHDRMDILRDFAQCITNWSVCDSCCATCRFIREHREEAWGWLHRHFLARDGYSARFGVVMLLNHYVQEKEWAERIVHEALPGVPTRHFYAAMAVAWCACELLLRHPAIAAPLLDQGSPNRLSPEVRALTLRKLRESHREAPQH